MASGPKPTPDRAKHDQDDWRRLHLWQIQPVRDLLVLAAVLALVYLGYILSLVTVPLLLAIALAYLFEPLVARLTARSRFLSRPGVAVAIIAITGLTVAVPATVGLGFAVVQGTKLVQSLATNIQTLIVSVDRPNDLALRNNLPGSTWKSLRDYIVEQEELRQAIKKHPPTLVDEGPAPTGETAPDRPQQGVTAAPHAPSVLYELVQSGVVWLRENSAKIGQTALRGGAGAVSVAAGFFGSTAALIFGAFLTAFFFFFVCTGYGRVLNFWHGLIPQRRRSRVFDLLSQMDRVISGFIRGRLTICMTLVVHYSVGYWLIGVPAPLILGPIVGLLSIMPYAAGVGIPVAILLTALDPGTGWQAAWWWIVLSPLVVHALAQVLDDYVLTPAIQGKSTGMDTPSILFASLAGGVLGGVYGLLLAIPAAACLKILLREVFWPRFRKWAEGKAKDFLPIEPG